MSKSPFLCPFAASSVVVTTSVASSSTATQERQYNKCSKEQKDEIKKVLLHLYDTSVFVSSAAVGPLSTATSSSSVPDSRSKALLDQARSVFPHLFNCVVISRQTVDAIIQVALKQRVLTAKKKQEAELLPLVKKRPGPLPHPRALGEINPTKQVRFVSPELKQIACDMIALQIKANIPMSVRLARRIFNACFEYNSSDWRPK